MYPESLMNEISVRLWVKATLGMAVSGWAHSAMTWALNDSDRNGVLVAWAPDLKL
ncbi:hypothetical protein D3C79_1048510 [compost metagenome]